MHSNSVYCLAVAVDSLADVSGKVLVDVSAGTLLIDLKIVSLVDEMIVPLVGGAMVVLTEIMVSGGVHMFTVVDEAPDIVVTVLAGVDSNLRAVTITALESVSMMSLLDKV